MKTKNSFRDLMNGQELQPITSEWDKHIEKGTLIGFKGLGDERGITAAYPVWRVIGNEIQFVLFWSEGGRPCIDNTWFSSSDLYINKEPIVLNIEVSNPETFGDRLVSLFNI